MKKILNLLLLLSLLFNLGCSTNSPNYVDFRTGSEGLSMRFLPYSPPSTIYNGDKVDFVLELSNKGAYDIRGGKLSLTGFDKNIIKMYNDEFTFEKVEGKGEYNYQGEKLIIDQLIGTKISLPEGVNQYNTPIEAIACYEYQTIASFPVCIDANPRVSKHDGCSVNDVSGSNQGGPIAVTHIDVEGGSGKMRHIITLKNVGGGELMNYNACPYEYAYNNNNNINNYEVSISGINLECQPGPSSLKMDDMGQARIYCKIDNLNENEAAYLTPITIKLNYDYKDSTSTNVRIKGNI